MLVTFGVMLFDMLKLRRILESWYIPVQISYPLVDIWIPASDIAKIRLEVLNIYRIESDYRGEKAYIDFSQSVSEPVLSAATQVFFNSV